MMCAIWIVITAIGLGIAWRFSGGLYGKVRKILQSEGGGYELEIRSAEPANSVEIEGRATDVHGNSVDFKAKTTGLLEPVVGEGGRVEVSEEVMVEATEGDVIEASGGAMIEASSTTTNSEDAGALDRKGELHG
jgi:hypothetical protein